jgi:hypothetical protein
MWFVPAPGGAPGLKNPTQVPSEKIIQPQQVWFIKPLANVNEIISSKTTAWGWRHATSDGWR